MSNPFNPFQTHSVLRFPPGARKRLCKLLIFNHFAKSCFLYPPDMVIWGLLFSYFAYFIAR